MAIPFNGTTLLPHTVHSLPGSRVLQTGIIATTCVLNVLCNIFCAFVVIIRSDKLRDQPGSLLVASLALLDGLLMSSIMGYRLACLNDFEQAIEVCDSFSTLLVCIIYSTILHLFLLSCDRHVFVFNPFTYENKVTPKKIILILIPAWLMPMFSLFVAPFFSENLNKGRAFRSSLINCPVPWDIKDFTVEHYTHHWVNTVVFLVIPFGVMSLLHGRIAKVSFQQGMRVQPAIRAGENQQSEIARRLKALKGARTIAIMLGAFLVTYIPSFTTSLIAVKRGTNVLPRGLQATLLIVIFIKSPINFFIYSLRSVEFKREFKKFLRKISCCFPEGHRPNFVIRNTQGNTSVHSTTRPANSIHVASISMATRSTSLRVSTTTTTTPSPRLSVPSIQDICL